VKVRAEDGRRIAGTDISNFIDRLPAGEDTRRFWTENASGSTSQAAAIAEALEVGAECLLIDEDTSATNFMIRDARMQALIADEHEPITPFIDRARPLAGERGVSTVLVVGGAGDYFDVADTVIAMRNYLPSDVTDEARRIAERFPSERRARPASRSRSRSIPAAGSAP
jgi:predicted ABC-class ATPase